EGSTCRKATLHCPCGFLGHPRRACKCPPGIATRYRNRVSGPLLERIDLFVEVPVEPKEVERLWAKRAAADGEGGEARARILAARERAQRRGGLNAKLEGESLR